MKKYFIIVLLLISSVSFSQKYVDSLYNFKVDNSNLIWQKVFEFKNNDVKKIIDQLKTDEFSSTLKYEKKTIAGRSKKSKNKLVKFSPYFAAWPFDSYLKIDLKENKIRVTATAIIFDGPILRVSGAEKKQNYLLENSVLKKGKINNTKKYNNVLKRLDSIFISKFTITNNTNDW
jgi:hypothetical protein